MAPPIGARAPPAFAARRRSAPLRFGYRGSLPPPAHCAALRSLPAARRPRLASTRGAPPCLCDRASSFNRKKSCDAHASQLSPKQKKPQRLIYLLSVQKKRAANTYAVLTAWEFTMPERLSLSSGHYTPQRSSSKNTMAATIDQSLSRPLCSPKKRARCSGP